MKEFFEALALSTLILLGIGAASMVVSVLMWLGLLHTQYGVPGLIIVWFIVAWIIREKIRDV